MRKINYGYEGSSRFIDSAHEARHVGMSRPTPVLGVDSTGHINRSSFNKLSRWRILDISIDRVHFEINPTNSTSSPE